jgi:hypothetical protein
MNVIIIHVTYTVIKIGEITKMPARKYLLNLAKIPKLFSGNLLLQILYITYTVIKLVNNIKTEKK